MLVWCYSHSCHQFRHINHYRYSGCRHTRDGRPLHSDPRQEMVSTSCYRTVPSISHFVTLPTYLTHLHNDPTRASISKCSLCNENLNFVFKKEIKTIFELWHQPRQCVIAAQVMAGISSRISPGIYSITKPPQSVWDQDQAAPGQAPTHWSYCLQPALM